jgi:TatD DNase family protein
MAMPRSRVLIETDGPFGTDGRKPLRPEDSWDTLAALASLWAIQPDEVRDLMRGNLASMSSSVEHGLGSERGHQRPAAPYKWDQAH